MPDGGFRKLYAADGPEGYYRAHADDYANPHEAVVDACVAHLVAHWAAPARPDGIDLSRVLDLAAGGGEATLALSRRLPTLDVSGTDPFTDALYRRRTGRECLPVSFERIADGSHVLAEVTCVVCSCAMHLAGDSWLPGLCLALSRAARDMVILTPMTRPRIREGWGWGSVEEADITCDGRSLRARWYRRVG